MSQRRLAYVPLVTYPDPVPDEAVLAVLDCAATLGADLEVTAFAVDIPSIHNPIAGGLINIPEMIRTTEESSRQHGNRLTRLIDEQSESRGIVAECFIQKAGPGQIGDVAAVRARYFDLTILPWTRDLTVQDLAESIVFGSGRPSVLIPAGTRPGGTRHVALAWDESRVAARALADALDILGRDIRVTVVTVHDEKPLSERGIADTLAAALERRGLAAAAANVALSGRSISAALQDTALDAGADLLVMGGYGHSRIRDFVLGGATTGIFSDLRLPVLVSH